MLKNAGEPTEERGDLIKFYNEIFIKAIQVYALKFSIRAEDANVPLSPVPHLKATQLLSPCHRIANHHSVFLKPLKTAKGTPLVKQRLTYNLGAIRSSPNNNAFRQINAMMQVPTGEMKTKAVKRILSADDEEELAAGEDEVTEPVPKIFAKKLHDSVGERMTVGSAESNAETAEEAVPME